MSNYQDSFRARFFSDQTYNAITSPVGVVGGAAVAAIGIAAGAPIAAAGLLGAGLYSAWVASRIPKVPPPEVRDPKTLDEPWRQFVIESLDAEQRFNAAVNAARDPSMKDALAAIGTRLHEGIDEVWRIATHGQLLVQALSRLEPIESVKARLGQVLQDQKRAGSDDRLGRTAEALQSQIDSTARILQVGVDTRDRLRLLDARIDETVARAVELSLRSGDVSEARGLEAEVESLVHDMEDLRAALDEVDSF